MSSDGCVAMQVTADAERQVRFGHPWLYDEAIRKQSRSGRPGDLAAIYDRRKRLLAVGLYDPASPIRVRILQRHRAAPIDEQWFAQRLAAAIAKRAPLARSSKTTAYRLVHGENDGLPGVVVDRYEETLVLKIYTVAWAPHLPPLVAALSKVTSAACVVLRLARAVQAQRKWLGGLTDGMALLGKAPAGPILFRENGLRFDVDVRRGQKTGWFLDQRDNRELIGRLAKGKTVFDGFAYTGGFSVYAACGGAIAVTSVEMSRPALEAARRHMALNRLGPPPVKAAHRTIAGDTFEVLDQLAARGELFDLVVLDPPSFANTRRDISRALAAYGRLVKLGLGVLEAGGTLVISSCSSQVPADDFFSAVHRAARWARRPLREVQRTGEPLDHPVGFREGAYLKCLVATVP